MRIGIELWNSSNCSLDSRIIEVAEAGDVEAAIAKALHECINDWVMSPGDSIRITEV